MHHQTFVYQDSCQQRGPIEKWVHAIWGISSQPPQGLRWSWHLSVDVSMVGSVAVAGTKWKAPLQQANTPTEQSRSTMSTSPSNRFNQNFLCSHQLLPCKWSFFSSGSFPSRCGNARFHLCFQKKCMKSVVIGLPPPTPVWWCIANTLFFWFAVFFPFSFYSKGPCPKLWKRINMNQHGVKSRLARPWNFHPFIPHKSKPSIYPSPRSSAYQSLATVDGVLSESAWF